MNSLLCFTGERRLVQTIEMPVAPPHGNSSDLRIASQIALPC